MDKVVNAVTSGPLNFGQIFTDGIRPTPDPTPHPIIPRNFSAYVTEFMMSVYMILVLNVYGHVSFDPFGCAL
jgi:hypothetical protein